MDNMKAVLITTKHRGVFFGYVDTATDLSQRTLAVKDARMAIRFGTTGGLMQLAETGPTDESRIGSKADIPVLHDVTAIFTVTEQAEQKWTGS